MGKLGGPSDEASEIQNLADPGPPANLCGGHPRSLPLVLFSLLLLEVGPFLEAPRSVKPQIGRL